MRTSVVSLMSFRILLLNIGQPRVGELPDEISLYRIDLEDSRGRRRPDQCCAAAVSSSFSQAVVDIPQVAILKTLRFISGGLLFNMNPYRFEFLRSHRDLNL